MSTHAGKTTQRLESDIQKLNHIINSLVEENYLLKTMLAQSTTPTSQNNKQQNK